MSDLIRLIRSGGPANMPGLFGLPMVGSMVPGMMQAVGLKPPEGLFPGVRRRSVGRPADPAADSGNSELDGLITKGMR